MATTLAETPRPAGVARLRLLQLSLRLLSREFVTGCGRATPARLVRRALPNNLKANSYGFTARNTTGVPLSAS